MWYWIEIFGAAGAGLSIIGGLYWAGAWLSVSRRILERVPEKELSAYCSAGEGFPALLE